MKLFTSPSLRNAGDKGVIAARTCPRCPAAARTSPQHAAEYWPKPVVGSARQWALFHPSYLDHSEPIQIHTSHGLPLATKQLSFGDPNPDLSIPPQLSVFLLSALGLPTIKAHFHQHKVSKFTTLAFGELLMQSSQEHRFQLNDCWQDCNWVWLFQPGCSLPYLPGEPGEAGWENRLCQ